MKIRAGVAVAMVASLVASPAVASEAEVVLDPGTGLDADRVETLLRIELPEAPRPTRITLRRATSATSSTSVEAIATFDDGSLESRTLDLTDIEPAQAARVVALAVAEACRTHVAAPKLELSPRTNAVRTSLFPPVSANSPNPRPWAFGAVVGAGLRALTSSPAIGPEVRAGAMLMSPHGFVASGGASYATFGASDPLGSVRVHAFGGYLGLGYEATLGSRGHVSVGPRLDVGLAAASGSAEANARASTTLAPTLALSGELVLGGKITSAWGAAVAVDAGSSVVGLDLLAAGREILSLRGASVGARLLLTVGQGL
jgi:hypothetical protein